MPPLGQRRLEVDAGQLLQQRQVFVDQLLLQIDGFGADHGGTPRVDRPVDQRHQIGEALAYSGRSFDAEVFPRGQRVGDRGGHLQLLRPELIGAAAVFRRLLERSAGGEKLLTGGTQQRRGVSAFKLMRKLLELGGVEFAGNVEFRRGSGRGILRLERHVNRFDHRSVTVSPDGHGSAGADSADSVRAG